MKENIKIIKFHRHNMKLLKKLSLVVAPFLVTSLIATLPTKAATFANSQGVFNFTEFSQSPSGTVAGITGDTIATAVGGTVFADFSAAATFIANPLNASNFSSAIAFGELGSYLGFAESEATIRGNFDIQANTSFSFKFAGNLTLATDIDNPLTEKARAAGEIYFALLDIDTDTLLDAFNIAGNLNTPGNDDYIAYDIFGNDNIFLNNINATGNLGENQENIQADIEGYYQRQFTNSTRLALVEVKRNRAVVEVPEPPVILALIIGSGVVGVVLKTKHKKTISVG
jgi:hypothetical protein